MMVEVEVRKRSEEIGALLIEARLSVRRSITECAQLIGTSRKRYRNIESGVVDITFVELEAVMQYLNVPMERLWQPTEKDHIERRINVKTEPGKAVHLIVELTSD